MGSIEAWMGSRGLVVRSISSSLGCSGSASDEWVSSTSSFGRGGRRACARFVRGGGGAVWVDVGFGLPREKRGVVANCDGGGFDADASCW